MGILSKLFSATKHLTLYHPSFNLDSTTNPDFDPENGIISTLLTCEKILMESISKIPVEVYQNSTEKGKVKHKKHQLYRLLHNKVNGYQTSSSFFAQLEKWRVHHGNAFAKIHRVNGRAVSFELVHPHQIRGWKVANNQLYYYRVDDEGNEEVINNDNILHFKFMSDDGVWGIDPRQALYSELNNIFQGKTALNAAYKNNLRMDKYVESGISNFNGKGVQESIDKLKEETKGAMNTGNVPYLPAGFKIVSIPQTSFQDAQVLQSIGFSKAQIYEFYGIPVPERKSYASLEQESLDFKVNTLQPIARHYRQELESKLLSDEELDQGISIEFNLNSLVETDQNSRINYLKTLHGMGVISSNDVAKMEGFETFENGDLHFMQMQYQPLEYQDFSKPQEQKTTKENEGKEDIN